MKTIPVAARGGVIKYAYVSDQDYMLLSSYAWVERLGYPHAVIFNKTGAAIRAMHTFLVKAPKGLCVDHVDRDRMNNQRENLRVCTFVQNRVNQKKRSNNTSGYIGVYYDNKKHFYRARLHTGVKYLSLGYFATAEEAASIRDQFASQIWGEFATLNFEYV